MKKTLIILAAGQGLRMGQNKMLMRICGKTPIEYCLCAAEKSSVDAIVIAVSEETEDFVHSLSCTKPMTIIRGGNTRGQSVYNALKVCDEGLVAIHDGARCAVSPELIDRCLSEAVTYGNASAAVPVTDTVRDHITCENIDRDRLYLLQTPQVFKRNEILSAYEKIGTDKNTDDCEVYITNGGKVHFCISDITNQKLTRPDDIKFFERLLEDKKMRIGIGEDTHRLTEGRKLILGGVEIDFRLGLLGHSDADVLCHAITDAILGACALGDIGKHFPDSDPAYKDADSMELLHKATDLVKNCGYSVSNIDATITAQEPKLAAFIDKMRENIANAVGTDTSSISVKATTPEHTNAEGRLECITVRAVAMLTNK